MNTTLTQTQNYSSLLAKLRETESENDLLKKEIELLRQECQEKQSEWETCLKDFISRIENHIESSSLDSSSKSATNDVYNKILNFIWQSFVHMTSSSNMLIYLDKSCILLKDKQKLSNLNNTDNSIKKETYVYELDYLVEESKMLKKKVDEQNSLIKSIISSLNKTPYLVKSKINLNSTNSSSALSSIASELTTTTSNEVDDYDEYQYESSSSPPLQKIKSSRQYFVCPKCEISIDKRQLGYAKFEQHVYKCEPSKLVCIFCLEIFDLNKEAEFDQHIQRHLRQVDISVSDSKKVNEFIQEDYQANTSNGSGLIITRSESSSNGISSNISSNLASSFSTRSNSNLEINTSTDSADSKVHSNSFVPQSQVNQQQNQQQQQRSLNSKSCLLIQNFEPKIRKRL